MSKDVKYSLQWHHNGLDSVSTHQPHGCLLKRLFSPRSKKTSKLRVTGLCVGNSPETGEFPAQRASNAENVSIWWRHHVQRRWCTIVYRSDNSNYNIVLWRFSVKFDMPRCPLHTGNNTFVVLVATYLVPHCSRYIKHFCRIVLYWIDVHAQNVDLFNVMSIGWVNRLWTSQCLAQVLNQCVVPVCFTEVLDIDIY